MVSDTLTEADKQFAKAIGARLRELRKKRRMTLVQVARAMGMESKSGPSHVRRIEAGERYWVALATVARFLQACGASFDDLQDVLGSLPARPVAQEPVLPKPESGQPTPEPAPAVKPGEIQKRRELSPAEQVVTNQRLIAKHHFRAELETVLHTELKAGPETMSRDLRKPLCDHGRRVFKILLETRRHPRRRQRRLILVRRKAEEAGLDSRLAARFEAAVQKLIDEMEREGALDWLPPAEAARPELMRGWLRKIEKAEKRLMWEEQAVLGKVLERQRTAYALMIGAPGRWLDGRPVTEKERRWYFSLAMRMVGELSGDVDQPDKGRKWVEALVVENPDWPLMRELADLVLAEFDKARAAMAARAIEPARGAGDGV